MVSAGDIDDVLLGVSPRRAPDTFPQQVGCSFLLLSISRAQWSCREEYPPFHREPQAGG